MNAPQESPLSAEDEQRVVDIVIAAMDVLKDEIPALVLQVLREQPRLNGAVMHPFDRERM